MFVLFALLQCAFFSIFLCLFLTHLQILKGKLNLPPYLTNEARSLIKKVRSCAQQQRVYACYNTGYSNSGMLTTCVYMLQ